MATCRFKKIYEPLFTTSARYYDLLGGRGRGGSYTGTDYFLHLITRKAYFRGCFLRNTFNDIRGSLFQDFKDRIEENPTVNIEDFDINENEMTIVYRPTGNKIISKGVTKSTSRTAKLKSLAGVTHVLIEEADEIGEEDFDQLDLSLRTVKVKGGVRIIRIFNPPGKDHWIWRDYNISEAPEKYYRGHPPKTTVKYYIATPRTDANLVAMFSTYHDNVKFMDKSTIQKAERFRVSKPHYYYTVILGLISEGLKGRVFAGWKYITDEIFNLIEAKSIFGLDFGLASPAGMVEIKFVKNNLYVRQQNYLPMTNKEIAIKLCQLGVDQHTIVADSAEPDSISRLRNGWELHELDDVADMIKDGESLKPIYKQLIDGFNIFPARKPKGSIIAGIGKLQELNIFVTEDSADLKEEYEKYMWALDKNKNPTDEPIDQFNHLIDPMRYVCHDRELHY